MKPSMFSKDYKSNMRKRKKRKRILILIFMGILLCLCVYYLLNNKLGSRDFRIKTNISSSKDTKQKIDSKKSTSSDSKTNTKTNKQTVEEKSYDVKLPDDQSTKVTYEEKSGNKVFKYIQGATNIKYNISSSGSKVIICDSIQNIILVNIDGSTEDITKKDYTASDGTDFSKDSIIKANSGYVWCSDPKFIDDNTIAYISQLPWINGQNLKYIWIYNIRDKSHTCIESVSGTSITEGEIDASKGLQFTIDGNAVYVNASGNVSN